MPPRSPLRELFQILAIVVALCLLAAIGLAPAWSAI
ncbi:hypothetical protein EDF56_106357 [Novosphingobium sp. PhB165]|nr:hypothetical protein EDF56_106357 [Novosphingobium sp. PhB165]